MMDNPAFEDRERLVAVVGAITVFSLVARFIFLGDRVAHWDEARVGYWTLNYMQTGNYSYSPIIHGPFYHHVNPVLFEWFGVTDFAMRIAPAFITGLLPLTALLFRDRLRRLEIVFLSLFLAVDPVVLYYSRFMRGDPLVGAFMFAGFALIVRAIDTGRGRHVVGAALLIALGFTTKENALIYVMSWIGALCLVLDQRLLLARYQDQQWVAVLSNALTQAARRIVDWALAIVVGIVGFFVIIVHFYAPRINNSFHVPGPEGGTLVGVWEMFTNPSYLLGVVGEATVGSFGSFLDLWGDGSMAEHSYIPYFVHYLELLAYSSLALCLFALLGFLLNRYAADRRRELLTFAFLWGVSSVFVYPLITDIKGPWLAVHMVLPLSIPAAVGGGIVVREGSSAVDAVLDRTKPDLIPSISAVLLAGLLVLAGTQIAVVGVSGVYLEPTSPNNKLVQYAQPTDDIHPTLHEIERIAANHQGTDVLIYGTSSDSAPLVGGDSIYNEPSCTRADGWYNTLPLPWYLVRSDASVECAVDEAGLNTVTNPPPVIIAKANHTTQERNGKRVSVPVVPKELKTRFEGYEATIGRIRTTDTDIVFLIDRDWRSKQSRENTPTSETNHTAHNQKERFNFRPLR